MMSKQKFASGLVYSTNKDIMKPEATQEESKVEPAQQQLKIRLDTKQRAGKVVTIVEGFEGAGMDVFAKSLKNHCGTGGSVKDGIVLVQGDNREKIFQWLLKNGFKKSKRV